VRVDASDIAHVYRIDRANQVRGESWIANVFTRLANWDDFEDAELMRQKVAACFGVVYTGVNPSDDGSTYQPLEKLEPGMIEHLPIGADMKVIAPPASQGLRDIARITHRAIASGLGVTYETITGDFSEVNFSSSRMAHLQMAANVSDWQEQIVIDLFCDRVWKWFVEDLTLRVGGLDVPAISAVTAIWNVPSRDMIDPEKEIRSDGMRVRNGFAPWSDVVRESGRDPDQVAKQIAADNKRFDSLGLVLDIDPRHVSSQGQGSVNQKEEGATNGAKPKSKP
jgi:lambda family phage portal protein